MVWLGGVLLVAGAVSIVTGILPVSVAIATIERTWPVLLFVTAITVVAELAAIAGVFNLVAGWLGLLARGRVIVLWLLVVLLAVVCTAFLSLDTTAVLLTPVVLALARSVGLAPVPFALTTVWLANTASLLLPISNLTNLLATHRLGLPGPGAFLSLLGVPALCSIGATVGILWLLHRRSLGGRYRATPAAAATDSVLLRICGMILLVLVPFLVLAPAPWVPALVAALVLAIVFAWRRPAVLRPRLVPWSLLIFATGLFLIAGALEASGILQPLGALVGTGPRAVWVLTGAGAIGSNLVNNLPAYLLFEPVTTTPATVAALLIGVNAGPLVTPWASLATLLWHQRLVAHGVDFSWRRYVLLGLLAAPVITAAAALPLALAVPSP